MIVLNKLSNLKLAFSPKISCLFLLSKFGLISKIFLPSMYFFKIQQGLISFLFLCYSKFISFQKSIKQTSALRLYFIKLRIRGLGYRYRSICYNVHYFFFNYTIFIIFLAHFHY